MSKRIWLGGIGLAVLACLAGLLLGACSTVDRTVMAPPEIEGATFVGNKACVDCHGSIARLFPASNKGWGIGIEPLRVHPRGPPVAEVFAENNPDPYVSRHTH